MTPRRAWRRVLRRTPPVPGNRLRLLTSGEEFFPALIAALDDARLEIHLETYIFHADASGESVRDALIRAAARGVAVKLMIDGVGARDFPPDWRARLEAAGVAVLVYRPPLAGWRFRPTSLRRLHRKIAIVDARIAFVGGMNLIDDYAPVRLPLPRLDFSVEVQGPLTARIHSSVRRLWRLVSLTQLKPLPRAPAPPPARSAAGRVRAAFVVRDNLAHRRDIEHAYHSALARATRDIVIANAYFLPGRRFRSLLKKAVARGVRVRLLVQGHTDHPFFQAAARALYRDLLAAGVAIHEYHASELHAKVAVVDTRWATVGSSNLDPLSLLMAREANIVVIDRGFAAQLNEKLETALATAQALDAHDWQRRPRLQRALSWLAYGVVRGIVGLLGGGRWV